MRPLPVIAVPLVYSASVVIRLTLLTTYSPPSGGNIWIMHTYFRSCRVSYSLFLFAVFAIQFSAQADDATKLQAATALPDLPTLTWDSPSANSKGSMPIGNGDIGANVWVEPSGDLVFLISKTDAWDENMRLVKIGQVRVELTPPLAAADKPFKQTLDLARGQIVVATSNAEVRFWIDANHPVIHVDASSQQASGLQMRAEVELWRSGKQPCDPGYPNFSGEVIAWPDVHLAAKPRQIGWFHRNAVSPWLANLKLQQLESLADTQKDPLLGRTFGALVRGDGLTAVDDVTLSSAQPVAQCGLRVHVLTRAEGTQEEWLAAIEQQADRIEAIPTEQRWTAHQRWWTEFWQRSWIVLSGDAAAESVTRAYALQRWMNACAGRGDYPIKFNGSIFVIDHDVKTGRDADYRRWGGCYWWQNTRLIYWTMLMSGDFEMMQPLFKLYRDGLPARKLATQQYYGHEGAFFPETMTIWSTYNDKNYGPNRTGKPAGLTDNLFIRRYWQCGIEMVALMLDYYDFTQDSRFRDETLLPFATENVTFFDRHWDRGSDGKIRFEPAQSLETWHVAVNPLPEIAGLRYLLPRLQAIAYDDALKNRWQKTLDDLPPIPISKDAVTNQTFLLPAESFSSLQNRENPELYAVFPYRLCTVLAERDMLETGNNTWSRRRFKGTGGWYQDAIQAAMLGRANEAKQMVAANSARFATGYRFPAMWGPNFDWIPDQDHGSVILCALQRMLMQSEEEKIAILPAWPKSWNGSFKLHAPQNTTVAGKIVDGKLIDLQVVPDVRGKQATILSVQ